MARAAALRPGDRLLEIGCATGKATLPLRAHPVYGRYLKQSKTGRLSLNRARIRAQAAFDGKFLVSASDDELSAEEMVSCYEQLWRIERVHRDLKHVVDVRPVYHRMEDRIRSHVLLCWLALLLIRVAENGTGEAWRSLKRSLAKPETNPLTTDQKELFEKLDLEPPPRYISINAPARRAVW